MPNVLNEYQSDGVSTSFEVSMLDGYLNRDYVKFYLRNEDELVGWVPYTNPVTWVGPYTFTIPEPVPAGMVLVCMRETPANTLVDFENTSRITERNLNTAFKQSLHRTAELEDWVNRSTLAQGNAAMLAQEAAQDAAEAAQDAAEAAEVAEQAALDAMGLIEQAQEAAQESAGYAQEAAEAADTAVAVSNEALDLIEQAIKGNVDSFNGRDGAVMPQAGDYTPDMVGFVESPTNVLATPNWSPVPEWANAVLNRQAAALADRTELLMRGQRQSLWVFATLADAEQALPTILDGQTILVLEGNCQYKMEDGALVKIPGGVVIDLTTLMTRNELASIKNGSVNGNLRVKLAKALDIVNSSGGVVFLPPGNYVVPYVSHSDEANWLTITHDNVRIAATPGSVKLENFLFYVKGAYGPLVRVVSDVVGNTVNTTGVLDVVDGDYIQLLGAVNAYTPDAGVWQLGSKNPTNLILPNCRHSEILRVANKPTSTSIVTYENVQYVGVYTPTTGAATSPIPGVVGAEVRKLSPVKNTTFSGIEFVNRTVGSFRGVLSRCAAELSFVDCTFTTAEKAGAHVRTTDTYNVRLTNCKSTRRAEGASGSGWNTFLFGGGTQGLLVEGCTFSGEVQNIDVTPNTFTTDIGSQHEVVRCEYMTAQHFKLLGNTFNNCSDGFTTHPATYNLTAIGNHFLGCSTGIRSRSKGNVIAGNTFRTYRAGVEFSAFYEDTLVQGNTFANLSVGTEASWQGVTFSPMSSEIMNNNNVNNVTVVGNSFMCSQRHSGDAAVLLRHAGNGVPSNASFDLFTDVVKSRLSLYRIEQNMIVGCSIVVNRWVNGVSAVGNRFYGKSGAPAYIVAADNSARHTVFDNHFNGNYKSFILGAVTTPAYPYSTEHRVGDNYFDNASPLYEPTLVNVGMMVKRSSTLNYSTTYVSGSGARAYRASGPATLRWDVDVVDGASTATVEVFGDTQTTGDKRLVVKGRLIPELTYPGTDNTHSLGVSRFRWSQLYVASGTVSTSDEREKHNWRTQNTSERDAALELKGLIRAFKFVGRNRTHFGVGAQTVGDVLRKHGLNPEDYAFWCYDEWDYQPELLDEDGKVVQPSRDAGSRYGIRYDELAMFILAAL